MPQKHHRQCHKPTYNFTRIGSIANDPTPEPTPFPIKIVQDPLPPLPDIVLPPPRKIKSDYFYPAWDKFLAVQPARAKTVTRNAKKLKKEKEVVEEKQPDGLQFVENAAKSYEQASTDCREKVAAIVEECKRLNQKYIDALFNIEDNPYCLCDLTGKVPMAVAQNGEQPPWIKRVEDIFEKPQFYIDGATANDIHQGNAGDCWFLAALMAITAKPDLIHQLCVAKDEKIGVYGFVFYRDGEWTYEVIDDKLYMRVGDDDDLDIVRNWRRDKREGQWVRHDEDKLKEQLQQGGEALYFSHCKSNETWLPLIEKAYAKAHGDYTSIEGGWPSEGIEDLTGGVATTINPEDIMDKDLFWKEQMSQVNQEYLFGGGSRTKDTKGVIGCHAYTVLRAWEEGDLKLLKLRNPWGQTEWEGDWSDGSKLWTADMMKKLDHTFGDDGVFWMSYKDFFKHFPNVNRVRLFDKSWQVSQRWTCVDVPWTVDYLDTRFELTVAEQTPIVVVLSQPDSRYFTGLEGRYRFALHFRLYRKKESGHKYLMRSMHASGNDWKFTRSVSAELKDLEPGKYFVIFKITASRTDIQSAEEAVVQYAGDRKEKLLEVGRRYDYAQTKGNLRAVEGLDRKSKRSDARSELTDKLRHDRKVMKMERERALLRKKRIEDAMEARVKAYHEKKVQRRKEIREKQKAKKDAKKKAKDAAKAVKAQDNAATAEEVKKDTTSTSDDSTATEEGKLTPATTNQDGKSDAEVKAVEEGVEGLNVEDASNMKEADQAQAEQPFTAGTEKDVVDEATQTEDQSAKHATPEIPDAGTTNKAQAESKSADDKSEKDASSDAATKDSGSAQGETDDGSQDAANVVSSSDEEWQPEITPPASLMDDDFRWDSDLDGAVDPETSSVSSSPGKDIDMFEGDPWNARCVIGLRVYSKCEVKITVRTTDDEDEENEVEV